MKGTRFAAVYFLLPCRCFKLPTQLKKRQNAVVFSVNGTQQNKQIKDASVLVLKAERAYCIRFNLQGKCFNFVWIEKDSSFQWMFHCSKSPDLFIKAVLTSQSCVYLVRSALRPHQAADLHTHTELMGPGSPLHQTPFDVFCPLG